MVVPEEKAEEEEVSIREDTAEEVVQKESSSTRYSVIFCGSGIVGKLERRNCLYII